MPDVSFSCPHCDKHLVTDDSGADQTVQCPKCGQDVIVPVAISSQAPSSEAPASSLPRPQPFTLPGNRCPRCGKVIGHSEVICPDCGCNPITGQRIVPTSAGLQRN